MRPLRWHGCASMPPKMREAARAAAALALAATSLEECYGVDAEVKELRRLEVLCKSSR